MRLLALTIVAAALAQPQETPAPGFAVASIRPADPKSTEGSSWRTTPAGDIRVHSVPMLALITSAYGVQGFQVAGYPAWVLSDRFDVEAKSGGTPNVQASLQALLAERCKLVVQHATKTQDVWALTVDRRGSKLRPVAPHPEKTIRRPFGMHAEGMTMPELARTISTIVRAPVTDETRLTGAYAFDLRYSESPEMAGGTMAPSSDTPEVFRALTEQLGLVLVRRKAPVEVLVVAAIEKPSAN